MIRRAVSRRVRPWKYMPENIPAGTNGFAGPETDAKTPAPAPAGAGPAAKRPALIAALAWFFVAFGGWHAARAAYDNFALAAMFSSPGFMLGLAGATMPVEAPPLARFAVAHIRLVFIFYFIASLSVFITGAGLLFRKAWALSASKGFFYLGAACCLLIFLFPGLLVPKPYFYAGISLAPEFNAAVGHMRFLLRLTSAFPGAAFLWFSWRLEKPDVKSAFGLK